jgi:hypothetical protein
MTGRIKTRQMSIKEISVVKMKSPKTMFFMMWVPEDSVYWTSVDVGEEVMVMVVVSEVGEVGVGIAVEAWEGVKVGGYDIWGGG